MGFTAINASSQRASGVEQPERASERSYTPSESIASSYLGRGELANKEAFCGPPAKAKRNKRGNKGAVTTGTAASSRKRRKVNTSQFTNAIDHTSTLPIIVNSSNSPVNNDDTRAKPPTVLLPSKLASVHANSSTHVPKFMPEIHIDSDQPSNSIHLYSSSTSMTSARPEPSQTSMEAFNASSGYGCTVYNVTNFVNAHSHNTAAIPGSAKFLSQGRKRTRRRMSAAREPQLSPVIEEPDFPPAIDAVLSATQDLSEDAVGPIIRFNTGTDAGAKQQNVADEYFEDEGIDDVLSLLDATAEHLRTGLSPSKSAAAMKKMSLTPDKRPLSIAPSRRVTRSQPNTPIVPLPKHEDSFDLSDIEEDVLSMVVAAEAAAAPRTTTPPPRSVKHNTRNVHEHNNYGGALLPESERQLFETAKQTELKTPKPIVRRAFPNPILDRSPIFGASNNTTLRTCFRVGEALNVGCNAVRFNKNVIFEFYARVTSSWRDDTPRGQQHFVFKDLYHDKPPYMTGSFELWEQSAQWDRDSAVFLKGDSGETMCRAIAQMKRDGTKWRAKILNIWEASWADVNFVARIYARDEDFRADD